MSGLPWMCTFKVLGSLMLFCAGSTAQAFSSLPTNEVLQDPSILEDGEPIDVVYTWVDGSDSKWKASRKKWLNKTNNVPKDAKKSARFRSHDELKYSLRSINEYAKFVRHIFIVTAGQKPKWLKNHPKITVVPHLEIFKHTEYLPTFNSIAIEANLHHIPGLANRYIYFNDDVFLGKRVTKQDFYERPYKIKVFLTDRKIFDGKKNSKKGLYQIMSENMASFLENHFKKSNIQVKRDSFFYHAHTPFPMIKWIANLAEKNFHHQFKKCSSHKFRSIKDMSITNGLIPQYALRTGVGVIEKPDSITLTISGNAKQDRVKYEDLLMKRPKFFCIQDAVVKPNKAGEHMLKTLFEAYFPEPAPWEKPVKTK